MAMTKKEKEALDALILKVEILGALRWTQEVLPDIPAPVHQGYGLSCGVEGWSFNTYSGTVYEAWSEARAHGTGKYEGRGRMSGSRGGVALYSSKELALKGLRYDMEMQFAEKLQKVDKAIQNVVESKRKLLKHF